MKKKSNELTELGRAGGARTLRKYGKKHFSMLAKKRWAKRRKAEKHAR